MLKGIDPVISPDLLRALAQMGHGDEIAIVDANFPSVSVASQTVAGVALRVDCDAVRALKAVLSLLPVDDFEPDPVLTMQVVGDPDAIPPVIAEAMPVLAAHDLRPASLERFAFYERAKTAFVVLRCADTRPYGNFIIRKGIIAS
ncbi:RbsD/FucU family protein [Paracoccus sp. (in: a-proteobacteria)]|uniref:RbsD/FucU family protein n=1 Tax=Paracoccus sp. TaxID=267 RepID=UPI003A88982A